MKREYRFSIVFKDGKAVEISAFNAEQASILASAARIQAGEAPQGFEHRIREIRNIVMDSGFERIGESILGVMFPS